jgi:ABC-2 type transport system permease protein
MEAARLVSIVFWKEWLELSNAKILRRFLIWFPIVLIIQTIVFVAPIGSIHLSEAARDQVLRIDPSLNDFSDGEIMQTVYARRIALFILLVPMSIGIQIGAFAFSGEKMARTLEPLLATPISSVQLLFAKMLSGIFPALLIGFALQMLYALMLHFLLEGWSVAGAVFTFPFYLLSLIGSPLLALIGMSAVVIASAKTDEPRLALQLANLVVLPVLSACVAFIFMKGIRLDFGIIASFLGVGLIFAIAGLWLSARLFQREKILSR